MFVLNNMASTIIGYFNDFNVEVLDKEAFLETYGNGSFGKTPKPSDIMEHGNDDNITQLKLSQHFASKNLIGKFDHFTQDLWSCEKPITLFLEEAFFMHFALKCLEIQNLQRQTLVTEEIFANFCNLKSTFPITFIAYHYLCSKNWTVKSGIKFGGDFVLYKKGPQYDHAMYIVIVRPTSTNGIPDTSGFELHGHYRVAENAKKNILFLEVNIPDSMSPKRPNDFLNRLNECTTSEMVSRRFDLFKKNK